MMTADLAAVRVQRLRLDAPVLEDLRRLHEIDGDPLVWQHFPSLRHTDPASTETMLYG